MALEYTQMAQKSSCDRWSDDELTRDDLLADSDHFDRWNPELLGDITTGRLFLIILPPSARITLQGNQGFKLGLIHELNTNGCPAFYLRSYL